MLPLPLLGGEMSGQYPAAPGALTTQPFWRLVRPGDQVAVDLRRRRRARVSAEPFPACT